ncbi:MAG: FecR domain-containing protein [Bacteroides cellulosilyticus]
MQLSRTVYLDGEAYFQIAKDDKRPFRVITANGIVKQYGTSFNVQYTCSRSHESGTGGRVYQCSS